MVTARSRGDGRRYRAHVGRLGGLAVALGVGFAVATIPAPAWAEPTDDTNVSTESAADSVPPAETNSSETHSTDADDDGAGNDPAIAAVESAGGQPSQSEVTLGNGGPEVTIRHSGGYVAEGPDAETQQPSEESAEARATAVGQEATPSAVALVTTTPDVPTAAGEPEDVAGREYSDRGAARNKTRSDPLYGGPLVAGFEVAADDAPPTAQIFGSHLGPTVVTTPARAMSARVATAAPVDPIVGPPAASDGLLGAASALLSGVLNVLFVPTQDGMPSDSPIVWAVLGLVRRQFNGTASGSNPVLDPRQTSRDLGGDERTFTIVTDRYAYVLDRDSNAMTIIDVDTREVVDAPVGPDQLVSTPVASPDGSTVFVTTALNGGVYAVDATYGVTVDIDDATAHKTPIVAGGYSGPNDYYVPNGGLAFSPDGTLLYVSRQHAQIVSGLFMPAEGDVVVIGNDPSDPATYRQVIDRQVDVDA